MQHDHGLRDDLLEVFELDRLDREIDLVIRRLELDSPVDLGRLPVLIRHGDGGERTGVRNVEGRGERRTGQEGRQHQRDKGILHFGFSPCTRALRHASRSGARLIQARSEGIKPQNSQEKTDGSPGAFRVNTRGIRSTQAV